MEIINLDSQIGTGMPNGVAKCLSTSGKQIVYSGDEIQERDSVLCGHWCLYYFVERQKGRSIVDTIHNAEFSFKDQSVIITYLKK